METIGELNEPPRDPRDDEGSTFTASSRGNSGEQNTNRISIGRYLCSTGNDA